MCYCYCYSLMSTICMKLDPGIHIGMHLVCFSKTRCDRRPWAQTATTKTSSQRWHCGGSPPATSGVVVGRNPFSHHHCCRKDGQPPPPPPLRTELERARGGFEEREQDGPRGPVGRWWRRKGWSSLTPSTQVGETGSVAEEEGAPAERMKKGRAPPRVVGKGRSEGALTKAHLGWASGFHSSVGGCLGPTTTLDALMWCHVGKNS
jgi:hypothetical protein